LPWAGTLVPVSLNKCGRLRAGFGRALANVGHGVVSHCGRWRDTTLVFDRGTPAHANISHRDSRQASQAVDEAAAAHGLTRYPRVHCKRGGLQKIRRPIAERQAFQPILHS
jgi:hypothetical protein